MNLVERYLGAVRWNLPADKADDIVAELADLIAARIEDREEGLGRPLTQRELSALLRDFGHPLTVAGQYHGQRTLIGAEVFPFYWFALRIAVALGALIEAIEIGGRIIVGQPLVGALVQGLHEAAGALLLYAAIVTLVFALIERTGWLTAYLANWKPDSLPALKVRKLPRKPWEAVFEIAMGIGFLLWWVGALAFDPLPLHGRVGIVPAPVWATLYWPVIALVTGRIVQQGVALLFPTLKPLRASLSIATAAGTLAIVAMLHQAGRIVTVTAQSIPAGEAARIQQSLDLSLTIALVVCGVIAVCQCGIELWRLARER